VEHTLLAQRQEKAQFNVQLARYLIGGAAALAVGVSSRWSGSSSILGHRAGAAPGSPVDGDERGDSGGDDATGRRGAGAGAAITSDRPTVTESGADGEQASQRRRGVASGCSAPFRWPRRPQGVEDSIVALGNGARPGGDDGRNILALASRRRRSATSSSRSTTWRADQPAGASIAAIERRAPASSGKGFAVVAARSRALADQSKKATAQVGKSWARFSARRTRPDASTEEVTKGVAAAAVVAGQSGEAIKALADTLAETAQAAAQIRGVGQPGATGPGARFSRR